MQPRASASEAAPACDEAFFCMAPRSDGRAAVMTDDTWFESRLRFFAMVLAASLLVKAPKMFVKSMFVGCLIVKLRIERQK